MRVIMQDYEKLLVSDILVQVVNLSRATHKEASQLKKNLDDFIKEKIKKSLLI